MKTEKLMIAGLMEDFDGLNKAVDIMRYSLKR